MATATSESATECDISMKTYEEKKRGNKNAYAFFFVDPSDDLLANSLSTSKPSTIDIYSNTAKP